MLINFLDTNESHMRAIALRIVGILGLSVFLPLFLSTFADPHSIEQAGRSFVEWKVKSEIDKKIDTVRLPEPTKLERLLGTKARELREQTELKLKRVRQQLKTEAPASLATELAKLRNLDCECRKKWETSIKHSLEIKLISLQRAKSKLTAFTQMKYMEVAENLTLDVRIFLGANSLVFFLLSLLSLMKPMAIKQLYLPGGLMVISSAICSYFYLFQQNWFYTIIYNDYVGFAYIGYLAFIFAILYDIAFNKARVTTEILNACLQAVGQAGNLVSC